MTSNYEFSIDDKVRMKVGPFENFTGSVVETNKVALISPRLPIRVCRREPAANSFGNEQA